MRHRLTRKFLAYLDKKRSARRIRISAGEAGISVESPEGAPAHIPWDRITRIVAFKRDLYGSDLICLLIEQADGALLEINEQTPGWLELIGEMPIRLPAAKPYTVWFPEVAFPAFDVCRTSVFLRE